MANALTFIESNAEELDKEEQAKRNKADLAKTISKLSDGIDINDLTDLQISLLLEVITKADSSALSLIQ